MADVASAESKDPRLDFIQVKLISSSLGHWMNLKSKLCCFQDFALRSLRLKPDKWARMVVSDEQRNFINNFVDRGAPQVRQNKYDGNCLVMTLTKRTVYNRLGLSFTWLFTRVFAELTTAIFQKNFAKELVLLVTPRFCVLSKPSQGPVELYSPNELDMQYF